MFVNKYFYYFYYFSKGCPSFVEFKLDSKA